VSEIPYAPAPPIIRRSDEEPHRALRAPRVMGDLSGTLENKFKEKYSSIPD